MAVAIRVKTPPTQIHDHLQTGVTRTVEVNTRALEHELHSVIHGEVRFSAGDRGLYSSDASNYRQVPIGVVIPRDKEDVILTVASFWCHVARTPGSTLFPYTTLLSSNVDGRNVMTIDT